MQLKRHLTPLTHLAGTCPAPCQHLFEQSEFSVEEEQKE